MSFYLAIVSPLDAPLFELSFTSSRPNATAPTSSNTSTSSFPSWSTFTGSNGSDLGQGEQSLGGGGGANGSTSKVGPNLGLVMAPTTSTSGGPGGPGGPGTGSLERHMCQMIAHKSLDSVEEVMESTGALYLKNVDRHNEWTVSAFLAGAIKFILLHDNKNDDGIRSFFLDLWEVFVKVSLNPFHSTNTPIRNPMFEARIRTIARRYL
ncbi:Sedlin [Kockovaella imperatae]|uniref:Sedlin n=1 Tax=Kockovaella imperatae TaxID=4999 RepID=A0A1Y1UEG7_9TREE|nr:Sedlin [Kockovaella imperatae]ORX35904.1 Sedlin [Kockovaella imperatae]